MKKILLAILFSFLSCSLFAQFMESHFLPVSNGEANMKIAYNIPDCFEEFTLPEEQQEEISPDRSFKVNFDGFEGEVHFVLFADTGVDEKNPMREFDAWNNLILMNLAGLGKFTKMRYTNKLAKLFKANVHGSCQVNPVSSNFAGDYKFAFVDSTYKKGRGICMRIFLMNDPRFAAKGVQKKDRTKTDFFKHYRSFSF